MFDSDVRVALFKGSPGGPSTTPVYLNLPSSTGEFDLAGEADVNGDGFGDIVVGMTSGQLDLSVGIYYGNGGGYPATPDLVLPALLGDPNYGVVLR